MPEIRVGLAPGKNSFWDDKTKTYLTIDKPVKKISYSDPAELSTITHAIFCNPPALKLYEGSLPDEAVNAWKNKFGSLFSTSGAWKEKTVISGEVQPVVPNSAYDRAERLKDSGHVVTASSEQAEILEEKDLFSAQSAEEQNEATDVEHEVGKKGTRQKK